MNALACFSLLTGLFNPNAYCRGRKFILVNSKQNKGSDRETRFSKVKEKTANHTRFGKLPFRAEKFTLILF